MSPFLRSPALAQKCALRFVDGDALSYAALESASCALANALRGEGLNPGAHVAFLIENRRELIVCAWAAQRAGLYYTPVATHLKQAELSYILSDAGAELVVTSSRHTRSLRLLQTALPRVKAWISVDEPEQDFIALADFVAPYGARATATETEGSAMLYSSGTTGRPKGVKRSLSGQAFGSEPLSRMYASHEMDSETVFLSPAPLYHAAPLRAVMAAHRLGARAVVMERFDAERFLETIEVEKVTHAQVVPTMLNRLLDLPRKVRDRYDLSTLRRIIHAAAPCPIETKQAVIDWLGPIVNELYGGTEGVGVTYITSPEWLRHKGSVGRAIIGEVRIVGERGEVLGPGQTGLVYFANGPAFSYHNAPEKMAEVTSAEGWITLGDIGRVDEEGYLYLVDRRSFVINSGGVNIYPQEVEETLLQHPDIVDAAVFGIPHRDFGEEVKAVVQMRPGVGKDAAAAEALIGFCRARISHVKCPRSIDFIDSMPRSESGKLMKADLKRAYWPAESIAPCQ